ncbi:MAG: electron transfer flavoprotein subunit beta/FixA family protein [Clostridiales Family XIII bacterium]|jgi:electron transfer flavoprotein beta subunit|nr:electron transfer flavoprotein subunit beta/FixA family protein [Clostridiales Family XIII bacterium]
MGNIVVAIKQVFDTEAVIAISGGKISDQGVKLVVNPFDEFAIEEALKIKEAGGADEVTIVSVGGEKAPEAIRTALAMGADKGIHVDISSLGVIDEFVAAEYLAKAIATVPYDLVLAGRIAIDDGSSQVAVRAAEVLGIPSVSSILKLDIAGSTATVSREIDGGTETIEIPIPALFTAQKGLNEPRLPSMMGIMKAKKKDLTVLTPADLGVDATAKSNVLEYSLPPARAAGKKLTGEAADTAAELAKLLREEAKVI